jgi:hypothetical protein
MSDRPDLIQSELAGLAFDALQQCFRATDIDALMASEPPPFVWAQQLYMVIDPAAGGPQSDFAFVTFYRHKGLFVVSLTAIVFHFELALELIEPHGFVYEEARHQIIAQALQETNGLVRANRLQSRSVVRVQCPVAELGLEVQHQKEKAFVH